MPLLIAGANHRAGGELARGTAPARVGPQLGATAEVASHEGCVGGRPDQVAVGSHGEAGLGLGASHQTGWTALLANLIDGLHRPATGSSR